MNTTAHNDIEKVDQGEKPSKVSGEEQVKHAEELCDQEKKEPNKAASKEFEGKVRNSSVSLLRLPSRPSATPPSPNQTPASRANNRSVSPAPGQSLGLLERPLVKHITEGIPYNEEQLKSYTIQAIVQKEITYKSLYGEEDSPILGKSILKGTKGGSPMNQKKKARLGRLEDRLREMSKKNTVKEAAREMEEGKKRGRLASQTEMSGEESLPKTVCIVSPKVT